MGRLPSDFWIVHTFPLALGCAIGYPKRTKMTEGAGTVKFQRITALLLAVCLCLTLIGCGNRSGGAYTMRETTLYAAFNRLERLGYVTSYQGTETFGRKRTYYTITDAGRQFYREKCEEWHVLRHIMQSFIKEEPL